MMNSDNLSTLFGSLQNKSAFSGVNLSEYALIKKGAYGKALKAYYAEQKDEPVKVSGAKKPLKKTESKAAESISMVKKSADTLSSSLSKLSSDELWSEAGSDKGREKVTKSISDFVSSYNDVLT
ncbi:MAG: hypothetical protein MJ107_06360, partial [Lachnospiraceae bacterium]|nr:hypothetical protein [Lachnospiraceae bacterium]